MQNPYRKALVDLERFGWHQGSFFSYKDDRWWPSACIRGALERTHRLNRMDLTERVLREEALCKPIAEVIYEQYPDRIAVSVPYSLSSRSSVALFNDNERTTFDDVRVVLEKSAIRWDETHDIEQD